MNKTLLVEIRTEELPPAQVWRLADVFPDSLLAELQKAGFADDKSVRAAGKKLATPRRFAALLENIKSESPEAEIVRRGPQTTACRDSAGNPTKALIGFMHSVGAACENDLTETEERGKKYIAWRGIQPGKKLADELAGIVERVLLNLPAPRLMRWGGNDFKFIRPVRGVLMLHGETHIGGKIMGVAAAKTTKGHPVLSEGDVAISDAGNYETVLRENSVIADVNARKNDIYKKLGNAELSEEAVMQDWPDEVPDNRGVKIGTRNMVDSDGPLLAEVAAMCEFPVLYRRKINDAFMALPTWCLSECLKKQQRFFSFTAKSGDGKLLQDYALVADNAPGSPENMLRGYDSVLRARLRDVQFYYEEDKKIPLADYVEKLKSIIFHHKLGSQHTRIRRVCKVAAVVSPLAGWDLSAAEIKETAEKILAPLSTQMVGEYPDLREYMAEEYFGETRALYPINLCYAMEQLAGMFGAGEIPTGSKDPHGLRKNAEAIARSLVNTGGWLREFPDIRKFIAAAVESFDGKIAGIENEIHVFILDRIRFLFSTKAPTHITYPAPQPNVVESLLSRNSYDFRNFTDKIRALVRFAKTMEIAILTAETHKTATLAAANKRINNIFRKSGVDADALPAPDESLFSEEAERDLFRAVLALKQKTDAHIAKNDYGAALQTLAEAAAPVDAFFDKVLVNAEDEKIRRNRFALLRELRELLNCVADISKLAA